VDAIPNGDDALELLRERPYDLVLLDEQMPGRRGLEVLEILRRHDPHQRVVMVTKSEEDHTMTEAIGRRVDDYLVKPASPFQVLSAVTRILEGSSIRQQQVAQDFAARWPALGRLREDAEEAEDFAALYSELVDWHIRLESAGEHGLLETVEALMTDLRRDFGPWIREVYPGLDGGPGGLPPPLPGPGLPLPGPPAGGEPVLFVVLDCMRLDQWRVMLPLLTPLFEVEEALHYSILPTATPYARNAIFSGLFPDEIARERPEWWERFDDEGSLNDFEDELLEAQLRREMGREVSTHYEKVFSDREGDQLRARVRSALGRGTEVVALVFNFMDVLIHSRSESPVFMEMARDERSLRHLTRSWFERSTLFQLLREASSQGTPGGPHHGPRLHPLPETHHRLRPAGRHLQPPLQVRPGPPGRGPSTVFATRDPEDLRLPPGRLGMSYVLSLEDYYMVYPTKLREYQARYRDAFLHGGVSPEEMIVPVALMEPRPR
jgi:CheY-like chemotaxis protein